MVAIDFAALAARLLSQSRSILPQWFPNGKIQGHEFVLGNLDGAAGTSLSINLNTGRWSDFASGDKGGDLISLYAAMERITQAEAARKLDDGTITSKIAPSEPKPERKQRTVVVPVPDNMKSHHCRHRHYGNPVKVWDYHDADGKLLGHVARYEPKGERKQIVPWTVGQYGDKRYWTMGQWNVPRPLYGLRELATRPDAPVMIVEGEKSADAARVICPQYVVVTWPGGSQAWGKASFNPLAGRRVLLWPDADEPGIRCMWEIGHALLRLCPEVKIIMPAGKPDGWDAADALAVGWEWAQFKAWAVPNLQLVTENGGNHGNTASKNQRVESSSENADRDHGSQVAAHPGDHGQPQVVAGSGGRDAPGSRGNSERTQSTARRPAAIGATLNADAHVSDGEIARSGSDVRDEAEAKAPAISQGQSQVNRWLSWGLDRNGNGIPLANLNNAVAILEHDPSVQGVAWFDEFLKKRMTGDPAREWARVDDINIALHMQKSIGISKMSVDVASQAVELIAYRNLRNCAVERFDTLVWDGTERIASFFVDCFGAADSAYMRAVGRNFWISMMARVYKPACQVDNMIVLEGGQGNGKSSALQIIGGEWYAAQHESAMNMRAFAEILQGKIIIEIEEMHAFKKGENEAIKKAITVRKDRFRPSGAHGYAKDHPRTCIFAGTTNRDDWNSDETGARRFWPIRCRGEVDLDLIRGNLDQLFAEAVAAFKVGATWWETPADETKREQWDRFEDDAWKEVIADYVLGARSMRINTILTECLKFEIGKIGKLEYMRVGKVLHSLGWRKRNAREGGSVVKLWEKSDEVATQVDQVATNQDHNAIICNGGQMSIDDVNALLEVATDEVATIGSYNKIPF